MCVCMCAIQGWRTGVHVGGGVRRSGWADGCRKGECETLQFSSSSSFPTQSQRCLCRKHTHTQALFSSSHAHTLFCSGCRFFFRFSGRKFRRWALFRSSCFCFLLALSLSLLGLVFFLLRLPKIMRKNYAVKSRRRRRRHRETGIGSAGAHAMHSHTQQRKKKRNFPLVKTGWLCKTFPHTFFSCNAKFPKPMVATKLLDRGKI